MKGPKKRILNIPGRISETFEEQNVCNYVLFPKSIIDYVRTGWVWDVRRAPGPVETYGG